MAKKIIFIHGRGSKPEKEALEELWFESVSFALERDFGTEAAQSFNELLPKLVYYGDISNLILHPGITDEAVSRFDALEDLKQFSKDDFTELEYGKRRGISCLYEGVADLLSGPAHLLNIGTLTASFLLKDLSEYWNDNAYHGSNMRQRLTDVLKRNFDDGHEVMLVAHSLGSVIAYDCLWKLSHYGEYRERYMNSKLALLLTIGSPLADENVKGTLKGAHRQGKFRYPQNIQQWINIAAEDDYISHDRSMADDFNEMEQLGLVPLGIRDIQPIYNLTVRKERSNPHSSLGYLMNPVVVKVIHDWMNN